MNIEIRATKKDGTSAFIADLHRKGTLIVAVGGQTIAAHQKAACTAVDQGNLRNSVDTEAYVEDGKPTSETGPTASYSPYIEYGTGIFAVGGNGRKGGWAYKDEQGNWHFTMGNRAQPFAEPGFQSAKPKVDAFAIKVLSE